MAVTNYTWPLQISAAAAPAADEVVSPTDRAIAVGAQAHLGYGLLRPFRRDRKNDFANGGGVELVKAAVGQVLGTLASSDYTVGEVPWRTEFGSLLSLLRHNNNDDEQQELARYYVLRALRRWEPRVTLKRTTISRKAGPDGQETVLEIRIVYDIIQYNVLGNQVVLPDVEQVQQITA